MKEFFHLIIAGALGALAAYFGVLMILMSNYMDEARAMRASIAGLAEGASDEKLINNKAAFPFWNENDIKYEIGENL